MYSHFTYSSKTHTSLSLSHSKLRVKFAKKYCLIVIMASHLQKSWRLSLFCSLMVLLGMVRLSTGYATTHFKPSRWNSAHATFYGDDSASETMGKLLSKSLLPFIFSKIMKTQSCMSRCHNYMQMQKNIIHLNLVYTITNKYLKVFWFR